jgi:hypothetical protein
MRPPVVRGVIRRRVLGDFRVDADAITRELPSRSRPKLHDDAGAVEEGVFIPRRWLVEPLAIDDVHSTSYLSDPSRLPKGSVEFDCRSSCATPSTSGWAPAICTSERTAVADGCAQPRVLGSRRGPAPPSG